MAALGRESLKHDSHHQGMDYIMLRCVAAELTKNASADSAGSIRYPATLSDLALWTSVTLLSEISIREHRRVAFGYSSGFQYKKNKNL